MEMSEKARRFLARHGFTSINGVETPHVGRVMPPNGIRRAASPGESTSIVRQYKPWYYHRLYCSHDRLWQHYCGSCARVGITPKIREARALDAVTWLMQQNLPIRSV